jgi:hypothetical protein
MVRCAAAALTTTTATCRRRGQHNALQKRDKHLGDLRIWEPELLAQIARVFGVAAGSGIYKAVFDNAQRTRISVLVSTSLGIFVAMVGGALIIWFSAWLINCSRSLAHQSREYAIRRLEERLQCVAAAVDLKVGYLVEETEDRFVAEANMEVVAD